MRADPVFPHCPPLPLSICLCSAAHLLSDVAGFLISLFAIWLAERPPSAQATWGYHR
jgi:Co/Zn/Cd efflux system component